MTQQTRKKPATARRTRRKPAPANESCLCLDGEMTIYRAAELKQKLLAHLGSCDAPEFDLSGVSEVDSAGVQLLLLAAREAEAEGKSLRLAAVGEPVREVLSTYRLETRFTSPPLPRDGSRS